MRNHEEIDLMGTDVFHFDKNCLNFNDLASQNGFTYWFASDYMKMLGYESYTTFKKAINRAMTTCMTLDIATVDEFEQVYRVVDDRKEMDFKLSRFACYLVAMNADNKKIEVAQAQAFFAASAETIRRYVDDVSEVERVVVREELSQHEKSISLAAQKAGVIGEGYALFQNAGYRGMYNMNLKRLKEHKGLQNKNRTLLDFMGKTELAANLFRLTQTEMKMEKEHIIGQKAAENVAEEVGRKVRRTMHEISGVRPEDLSLSSDIKKVKTSLKQTQKGLNKLDNKK